MNNRQSKYMALGMCFGMLTGSTAMSILAMFGKLAWGGLAIGLGAIIGMLVGSVIGRRS